MARTRSSVALVAAIVGLTLSACAAANGVSVGGSDPPTPTLDPPSTPATSAPATRAPTSVAPSVVSVTVPPTTVARPPATCSAGYDARDAMCYPTTVAPTTTLPPPALPEAAPALVFAVTPTKPGRSGPAVSALQKRLLDLGFWVDAVDGGYGHATMQAVMAFQKYSGLRPSAVVDQATADALNGAATRAYATANRGTLIEIDKKRQVLFVVQGGRTVWAVNTSTGSGKPYTEVGVKDPTKTFEGEAITPNGWFDVDRERAEGWWEGDLGKIYRPKYFRGGIAVHGMHNIPSRPVSHGCVRVSLPFMDFVWDQGLMPLGMPVWVHE